MDKVHVWIDGDTYWVEGGDFADMLESVKEIPGRRYDQGERAWALPGSPKQIAAAVSPYRLMYLDDDPLAESSPVQVRPA